MYKFHYMVSFLFQFQFFLYGEILQEVILSLPRLCEIYCENFDFFGMNNHVGFWGEVFLIPRPVVVGSLTTRRGNFGHFKFKIWIKISGQCNVGMQRKKRKHHSKAICFSFSTHDGHYFPIVPTVSINAMLDSA